jgi:hypothetical protein
VFSASLLTTIVTIIHSINLSMGHMSTTLIFAYVRVSTLPSSHYSVKSDGNKAALNLFICNILVIVTFLYRMCSKETADLDQSFPSNQVFTSVILTPMPSSTTPRDVIICTRGDNLEIENCDTDRIDEAKG